MEKKDMKLILNVEERDELIRILDNYNKDLRIEVRRTKNSQFKEELKDEQMIVGGVLDRLSQNDIV